MSLPNKSELSDNKGDGGISNAENSDIIFNIMEIINQIKKINQVN